MLRHIHLFILAALGLSAAALTMPAQDTGKPTTTEKKALKALLICGGCCHDYAKQSVILRDGIQARANVQVDVIYSEDKSTAPHFPLYANKDWAKGYDVIIHDECAASVKDQAFVQNVVDAHKTVPAINLHCAMHSFRTGTDVWFKYLGLQSSGHGPQEPIDIKYVDTDHPITEVLADWTTIKEELYNNINLFDAHPLAMGKQVVKNKDGTTRTDEYVVAWTNETQGARTFSTTIGHNNDTVADTRYLDLITRGLLWSADKLNPDYLIPYKGPEGTTTVLPAPPKEDEAKKAGAQAAPAPTSGGTAAGAPVQDGSAVKVTASSEESGKGNYAWQVLDGNKETRWCAANDGFPAWVQFEFPSPQSLTGVKIQWESNNNAYKHKIEASPDGKVWSVLADASTNDKGGDSEHIFSTASSGTRFVKITVLGTSQGGWASIREVDFKTDATLATATASTTEAIKNNYPAHAVDGNRDTRWCADSGSYPQWLQLNLDKAHAVSGITIDWESGGNIYHHKVEGSLDGKAWFTLFDATKNETRGKIQHKFDSKEVQIIKVTVTGTANSGNFASIREITLDSPTIKSLRAPFVPYVTPKSPVIAEEKSTDPYAKQGNIPPSIVKLTPEQEAAILKDVTVPEGFTASVFASPPAANYPVYVAAAPNGDLYISSDGNGSLGRNPKRGRILRLRDTDHDGRADQVMEFVKDVDSPRGLVWDHDRLYLVHPPHLSVFIDKNGDGVAEESKVLVKDIAFGFSDRPADHTTNGLSLGMDGWLYIAGGDFGFMKATGADGKTLQHRGGGVLRVRPDGTGLEVYATGTRNILEVAISPTMEMFARDNTNDGGGWNVRFHHFPGLTDHGYPRLYMNFPDEIVLPMADYGGGSGCGAVYIDEPGYGKWNHAPFTVDWGTNALWHHSVKVKGGTYEETEVPQPFVKMTRPTDADIDAFGHLYVASWKGATFNWEGPNVGYIVQIKPQNHKTEPLPDFDKVETYYLVQLLESPSYRRRMEAQRELIRRKVPTEAYADLARLINNEKASTASRYAAWQALNTLDSKQLENFTSTEAKLELRKKDSAVDLDIPSVAAAQALTKPELLKDPRIAVEVNKLLATGMKLEPKELITIYKTNLGNADDMVRHTAIHSLAQRHDVALGFAVLDNCTSATDATAATGALRALGMLHQQATVDGLIARLNKASDATLRQGLLTALCRLHFHEGEWKGDSWGTRPDTRGPYYQPEPWTETDRIATTLKEALAKADPTEAAFLVKEMNRNRIQSNDALNRILALAKEDPKVLPDAVSQLAQVDDIPTEGIPLLIDAARRPLEDTSITPAVRSQAIAALTKTDSSDAWATIPEALVIMKKIPNDALDIYKSREAAQNAFLEAPKLENHHQYFETEAFKLDLPAAYWTNAALLKLSARKSGSPESIAETTKVLNTAWQNNKHRVLLLKVIADLKHNPYADKVLAALDDPDKDVVKAAEHAARAMKLEKKTAASGPLIATLTTADVIAQIMKTKGDVALGEQLYLRQTCNACHTVREDEPQKGPYLGNIAQTYKRAELAESILDPNKTIAQGFATNLITTKDGQSQLGFVTFESANKVTIRNIAAQEFTFNTKDIQSREKPAMSMMPPGLVHSLTIREFASLLDYLEELSKK